MIYTDSELKKKIYKMIEDFESEVVEFKEATSNYSFNDIGKYFSALGNEANIRGLNEAWLIFGITNDKQIKGTNYRKDGNLQSLKKYYTEPFILGCFFENCGRIILIIELILGSESIDLHRFWIEKENI